MKAEPGTGLSCSDLDICLKPPEGPSPFILRGTKTQCLETRGKRDGYHPPPEGGNAAQPGRQSRRLPNKSTKKMDLCHSDMIFHSQKVHVGVVRRHSRHLVSQARSPGKVSAVSTKGVKPSEKNIRPTEVSNIEVHLPKVDLRKAERKEDMGTPLPQDEEITRFDLQELYQTGQNVLQTEERDELNNIAVLAEQVMEEKRDKSVWRRFLNWLNEHIHEHIMRKVARTYRRELEEGDDIYKTSFIARWPVMTRAEREQQKRQELLHQDKQRQSVKKLLDAYWEVQRYLKEALRLKEEERYEKWAAEHGASVPASSPEQPKERMSKWEKRFLIVKEFFSRESIFNDTVPTCQALWMQSDDQTGL